MGSFKKYGHFCTLHSLRQTLLQWVGGPHEEGTQSLQAVCLLDLQDNVEVLLLVCWSFSGSHHGKHYKNVLFQNRKIQPQSSSIDTCILGNLYRVSDTSEPWTHRSRLHISALLDHSHLPGQPRHHSVLPHQNMPFCICSRHNRHIDSWRNWPGHYKIVLPA